MSKNNAVIGLVATQAQAETIIERLKASGFANDDISALLPDQSGTKDFAHETNTKAPEGAVAGASAGGTIGGVIGLLAGIGALALPGIGPLIAAGPIMAAMSGVTAGAAVGGLAGAFIGMGVPEMEAKKYQGKVKNGNILVAVHVDDVGEQKRAKNILEKGAATDIAITGEKSPPAPEKHAEHRLN